MRKENHNISEQEFVEIAKYADGFSGSDINGLIKNACYEPLRKFQKAKFFRKVGTNQSGGEIWTPCGPSEPGATQIDKTKLK